MNKKIEIKESLIKEELEIAKMVYSLHNISPFRALALIKMLKEQLWPYGAFNEEIICSWMFKSKECGYKGKTKLCNKTFNDCKIKKRFGGFKQLKT